MEGMWRAQQHGLTKAISSTAATDTTVASTWSPGYGAVHQGDQPAVWSAVD